MALNLFLCSQNLQLDLLGCQSIPISQWLLIMHFPPVEDLMD